MSAFKGTPGPWTNRSPHIGGTSDGVSSWVAKTGLVGRNTKKTAEQRAANAVLIAHAPEMLTALLNIEEALNPVASDSFTAIDEQVSAILAALREGGAL